jgi:hypothetical protein
MQTDTRASHFHDWLDPFAEYTICIASLATRKTTTKYRNHLKPEIMMFLQEIELFEGVVLPRQRNKPVHQEIVSVFVFGKLMQHMRQPKLEKLTVTLHPSSSSS